MYMYIHSIYMCTCIYIYIDLLLLQLSPQEYREREGEREGEGEGGGGRERERPASAPTLSAGSAGHAPPVCVCACVCVCVYLLLFLCVCAATDADARITSTYTLHPIPHIQHPTPQTQDRSSLSPTPPRILFCLRFFLLTSRARLRADSRFRTLFRFFCVFFLPHERACAQLRDPGPCLQPSAGASSQKSALHRLSLIIILNMLFAALRLFQLPEAHSAKCSLPLPLPLPLPLQLLSL